MKNQKKLHKILADKKFQPTVLNAKQHEKEEKLLLMLDKRCSYNSNKYGWTGVDIKLTQEILDLVV